MLAALLMTGCRPDVIDQPPADATESIAIEDLKYPEPGSLTLTNLPLTVLQAYQAIPHRRTRLNVQSSKIHETEKAYLQHVFSIIDQGVALRVASLREMLRTHDSPLIQQYDAVVNRLQETTPPPGLQEYHKKLLQAVLLQRRFYESWKTEKSGFKHGARKTYREHPDVNQSSKELLSAYRLLMNRYGDEAKPVTDALFDYHCALDFK